MLTFDEQTDILDDFMSYNDGLMPQSEEQVDQYIARYMTPRYKDKLNLVKQFLYGWINPYN